jgi:hypothetical protein
MHCNEGYSSGLEKLILSSLHPPLATVVTGLSLFVRFHYVRGRTWDIHVYHRYDDDEGLWKATNRDRPNFLATSKASKASLLLGPQDWTIHNDSKLCSETETYTTRLKLTGCADDEFTCDDATCVPMAVRCDAKGDCKDGSDEANCKTVVTSVGYNRFNVPPPGGMDDKLKMSFGIDLRKIVKINAKQGSLIIKMRFVRSWTDIKLKYQNVKMNMDNRINPKDVKKMWKPWTILENIKTRDSVAATDRVDTMLVKTDGGFIVRPLSDFDNTYIFEGSENALYYERELTVEWMCDFDMSWYPFDTQSCTMQFIQSEDSIDLVPGNFTYDGPMDLLEHYVRDLKICSAIVDGRKGVVAEVVFGRPLFAHLLTTILPTVILIMICLMTTTFDTEYFDMVVMVNLTALLVLATL